MRRRAIVGAFAPEVAMHVTLVKPTLGRLDPGRFTDGARMEPLGLGLLAGLTPPGVDLELVDDRVDLVDPDARTDLVAITVETFTARRAYEIADDYRARGVKVVMGGMHPTLLPDEVAAARRRRGHRRRGDRLGAASSRTPTTVGSGHATTRRRDRLRPAASCHAATCTRARATCRCPCSSSGAAAATGASTARWAPTSGTMPGRGPSTTWWPRSVPSRGETCSSWTTT